MNVLTIFHGWKLAHWLIATLFVIAPLYYHPNIGGEGLRLPHNNIIWLVAVLIISLSLWNILKSSKIELPRYFWMLCIFPVIIILSGFIAGIEEPTKWLFRLLFIFGGILFLISLLQFKFTEIEFDNFILILVLASVSHSLMGIVQLHAENIPYSLPKSANGMPYGFFQQVNNQASFLATCIVMAFYLISRKQIVDKQVWVLMLGISVLLASFIIGYSSSRIGWLSLILPLPLLFWCQRQQFKLHGKQLSLIVLSLIVGLTYGATYSGGGVSVLDKTVAMESGYSGSARLSIYKVAADVAIQKPFFGHGIGSFSNVFQHAKPNFYEENKGATFPFELVSHPHNEIVFWLVEGGLFAVSGLFIVAFAVLLSLKRLGFAKGGALLAMLLPFSMHTMVELPFYMSALHWFIFLFVLGYALNFNTNPSRFELSYSMRMLVSMTTIVFVTLFIVFFVHTARANLDFIDFYKGEQNANPLPLAKQNPYLNEAAMWIDMSAMMYSSMEYGLKDNVQYFISWGEQTLNKRPDIDLYEKLLDAHNYLGNRKQFCALAHEGGRIYPDNGQLKKAMDDCRL
jgi:O-antigen polymerase